LSPAVSNARRWLGDGARIAGITVVMFLTLELLLSAAYFARNAYVDTVVLPYNAAQDFGPVPPWIDSLRILEDDEWLGWRNRRNVRQRYLDVYSPVERESDRTALLRQFLPILPDWLRDNPVWEVSLNSRGFRNAEFTDRKPPKTFRIACLGDSWTFGANVDQRDSYPQQLQALLDARHPLARFEVLNLGTLAYSSHQGLRVLEQQVLDFDPDLVLIGFGMNDSSIPGYRDKDTPATRARPPAARRLVDLIEELEVLKLLRYALEVRRHRSWSIGDYMKTLADASGTSDEAWMGGPSTELADYEALEPYTRVSPPDYETNLVRMIQLARDHGAGAILLHNQLWETPYRQALQRISDREGVQLVDSKTLIDRARAERQRQLEEQLALEPGAPPPGAEGDAVEVVFRVHQGDYEVPEALYVVGPDPKLGDGVPNRVALRDDGRGADRRAGDGVWSYAAHFGRGARIFYVYTNSGPEGRWEGVDVPEIRRAVADPPDGTSRLALPIDSFGRIVLQADGWHTNAEGYGLIAEAVLAALGREPAVQAHLDGVAARRRSSGVPTSRKRPSANVTPSTCSPSRMPARSTCPG
jgi:lysophospholipase L1-like esterase